MIITCPHCRTRYQVAFEAIGAVGRKVQCAECRNAWTATGESPMPPAPRSSSVRPVPPPLPPPSRPPEPDQLFDPEAEAGLDARFEAEADDAAAETARVHPKAREDAQAPSPPPLDPASLRKRQTAFSRRQVSRNRTLPMARVRRSIRTVALVALLLVLVSAYGLRREIVSTFPDLAGTYAMLGLPVNVVGLDFTGLATQTRHRDGVDVLTVSASIRSVSDRPAGVPRVMVALLDAEERSLYEWSVTPPANLLDPGESVAIETQLSDPPPGAVTVRLAFLLPAGSARVEPVEHGAPAEPAAGAHSSEEP